jgi:hypothetical protein
MTIGRVKERSLFLFHAEVWDPNFIPYKLGYKANIPFSYSYLLCVKDFDTFLIIKGEFFKVTPIKPIS